MDIKEKKGRNKLSKKREKIKYECLYDATSTYVTYATLR